MATIADALDEVSFVNPDAARARSRRRVKLNAARARLAALAASGGGASSPGEDGASPGVSEKEVRKQQRMLRNRESAALSRKRKSDRIGELEIQVEALQEENRRLRQRIDRQEDDGRDAGNGNGNGNDRVFNVGDTTASCSPPSVVTGNGHVVNTAASPPSPATAAWAPTDLAARAALAATSPIILPSASTTTIIPATPPAINSDLATANEVFRVGPGVPVSTASTCSATASSASSSSFPASGNACFNIISRPAVFA